MTPRWAESAGKHGVSRGDAIFAMLSATYTAQLADNGDGTVDRLYIGPEHAQTERELEIIVQIPVDGSGREAFVFHVMPLGPKFRHLREEYPNGFSA